MELGTGNSYWDLVLGLQLGAGTGKSDLETGTESWNYDMNWELQLGTGTEDWN